jgi:hypothetical protein
MSNDRQRKAGPVRFIGHSSLVILWSLVIEELVVIFKRPAVS